MPRFITALIVLLIPSIAAAAIPRTMSYQGVLTNDSGVPLTGQHKITFAIWDTGPGTGGTKRWEEIHLNVPVTQGAFSVVLGSQGTPLPLTFEDENWLSLSVDDSPDLTPRSRVTAVPYALNSRSLALPLNKFVSSNGSLFAVTNTGQGWGVEANVMGSAAPTFAVCGTIVASTPAAGSAGVRGIVSSNSTSAAYGVYGQHAGSGVGTYGTSTVGTGVRGDATGTGIGVHGTSVNGDGVVGFSSGPSKSGVYGITNSASGYGGYFATDATGGTALRAVATTGTAFNATVNDADAIAGYFYNSAGGVALVAAGMAKVNVLQIMGSDVAEAFNVSGSHAAPGLLVSIDPDHPGQLQVAAKPIDTRVAGIIAGAGDICSGVIMGQPGTLADGDQHVALSGRVYCWCDARYGAIYPGSFLTTSATPGHAMVVESPDRARGAIVGKAMTSLIEGRGLVLVLVSLQ